MVKKLEVGCQADDHRWEPVRFTENYRRCWRCSRIEVCVNDRWLVPTPARKKRSSSPYTEAYIPMMWTTLIGISYQDLQIRAFTPLFGSRSAALPLAATQVNMARRARIGQLLEAAGKRGYPDLSVYLPGGRRYGINSGLASWQLVCEHAAQEVIDGALGQLIGYEELPVVVEAERFGREMLVELGRGRGWQGFVFKMRDQQVGYDFQHIIGETEVDWKRFAYRGYYNQVLEACKRLQQEVKRMDADQRSMAISYYEWLVFFAMPVTEAERESVQLEIREMDEQARLLGLRFHLANQEALLDEIEDEEEMTDEVAI